jgi:hypothetical protein
MRHVSTCLYVVIVDYSLTVTVTTKLTVRFRTVNCKATTRVAVITVTVTVHFAGLISNKNFGIESKLFSDFCICGLRTDS